MKPEISAASRRIFIVFEFSKPFSKMPAEQFSLGGKCSEQSLSSIMLAIQKLKRIANRTIFDRDMIDKRFRNGKIISVMKPFFKMAAERFSLGGKCSEQSLSSIMLAIQKLKRIANGTIFDRDMIDKNFVMGKLSA